MVIPVFGLVMIFVIWLTYELKKHSREEKQRELDFWERERRAGFVPRKPTEDIKYIKITEDFLPKDRGDEEGELNVLCNRILSFKDLKIADLSSLTNTELKEKYGTANFPYYRKRTVIIPVLFRFSEDSVSSSTKTDVLPKLKPQPHSVPIPAL